MIPFHHTRITKLLTGPARRLQVQSGAEAPVCAGETDAIGAPFPGPDRTADVVAWQFSSPLKDEGFTPVDGA